MEPAADAADAASAQPSPIVITLTVDALRETFRAWRITGGPGYWYALREGRQEPDGPRSLLRCFLSAGNPVALAEKLSLQEYLDTLNDDELADVWRRVDLPHLTEPVAR